MRISKIVSVLLMSAASSPIFADEVAATTDAPAASTKKYYSLTPEGKSLPEGVARFRLPYQIVTGGQAFDKDGNKSDALVKYNATGSALIAEYGINSKMTVQWRTDFVLKQSVDLNKDSQAYSDLKKSTYSSNLAALSAATGVTITDQASLATALQTYFIGSCVATGVSKDTCVANYANGTLDSSSATKLGLKFSGSDSEKIARNYVSAASTALEQQISSGIASKAESTGGRGLGDTTVGMLYEVYHVDPVYFSIGGGVRFPTGNRNLSGTEMATTRAAYEAGVRTNLDLLPLDVLMLSWQNQSEVGFLGTKHKVGDTDVTSKRVGVRNVGFFYIKPSLGPIADSLDGIKTQFGFSYDYDSALRTTMNDVETTSARSQQIWMYAGLGYSLLNAGIPAQFDLEYEKPYMGKNLTASYSKLTATVKAFAKF